MTSTSSPTTATPAPATSALRVTEVRRHVDAVELHFAQPDPPLRYRPGQYLTITAGPPGREAARSYSLVTDTELDAGLAVLVKREPGGLVSNHLNDCAAVGDVYSATGPVGRFTLTDNGPVVLIGGGSGITPLYSLARAALRQGRAVGLIYGNREPRTVLLRAELDALCRTHPERFHVVHVVEHDADALTAVAGRFGPENASALVERAAGEAAVHDAVFYVCGPAGLMDTAVAVLTDLGVSAERIRTESFAPPPAISSERVNHIVSVVTGGERLLLPVPSGQSILDAARAAGLPWQYSCATGDCGTCRVRLLAGHVDMTTLNGLTEQDEADGYVLTCVGYPSTDDVVVEP